MRTSASRSNWVRALGPVQMSHFTFAEFNSSIKYMWYATFESIKFGSFEFAESETETVEDSTWIRHFTIFA